MIVISGYTAFTSTCDSCGKDIQKGEPTKVLCGFDQITKQFIYKEFHEECIDAEVAARDPQVQKSLKQLILDQVVAAQIDAETVASVDCACGYSGKLGVPIDGRPWAMVCPQCGKVYYYREGSNGEPEVVEYTDQPLTKPYDPTLE